MVRLSQHCTAVHCGKSNRLGPPFGVGAVREKFIDQCLIEFTRADQVTAQFRNRFNPVRRPRRRAHQFTGDASDLVILTSTPNASPRLLNDDQEHILASRTDRKLPTDERKLAVQLAAKKKQSINSGCPASVLRSHRK